MAAVATPVVPTEQRIVLDEVGWETYEHLLAAFADRSVPRLAYDQGVLEIVSPSPEHEEDSRSLASLVEIVATELDLDYRSVGSMTVRSRALRKGFEADSSFYIRRPEMLRGRPAIDPTVDPPPDLVIEIDVTNPAVVKLPIYAALDVPEVWRCQRDRVTILLLASGAYHESPISLALPLLSGEAISRFLVESRSLRRPDWINGVRAWVQTQIPSGDAGE